MAALSRARAQSPRAIWAAAEGLEGRHGGGLAEDSEAREAEGLRGVARGQALPAPARVGIFEWCGAVGGVHARDEGAGDGIHRSATPVADLRALEPGLVGLDHPAAREDEGVGGRRARESHENRGHEEPARRGQGRSSERGESRGEAPPWRKYGGKPERAASAAGRLS